jgi:hypothetical protein
MGEGVGSDAGKLLTPESAVRAPLEVVLPGVHG